MNLTFLGGAGEVGASSTLIEIGGLKVLVDAGIRVSSKVDRSIRGDQLPDLQVITEVGGVDFILVTHAHTDHTGALPLVVEQYPDVLVLATPPTIELVKVLQADAQRIMQSRQEAEGELPLFDEVATERLLNAFQPVPFRQPFHLGNGVQITFYPSGHIVGAGCIVFESDEGTLVMSGDVSVSPQRVVDRPELPRIRADMLVLESTYGGRLHANRLAEERRLIDNLRMIAEGGGKALIPAFALGRAQEVIQILLAYRDEIEVPVFVDGMVRSVCSAYESFGEYLPEALAKRIGVEPLFFREGVEAVKTPTQRQRIVDMDGPAIIVSSSGMLTGGPSAFYAHHLASNAQNAIYLSGYQDEEAPGRFLQRMMRERQEGQDVAFKLAGQAVTLRCVLDTYSLSAHADESELISIAETFDPAQIALVHGDAPARSSLASRLRDRHRTVALPNSGQRLTVVGEPRMAPAAIQRGTKTGPVNLKALWEMTKAEPDRSNSPKRLALLWWGDATREHEMAMSLRTDDRYFTETKFGFKPAKAAKIVAANQHDRLSAAYPNIKGQIAVLRTSSGNIRLGVITGLESSVFEAFVFGTQGKNFPYERLVWLVGAWSGTTHPQHIKAELGLFVKQVMLTRHEVFPMEQRLACVERGTPVRPEAVLPATLPTGVSEIVAVTGIASLLAEDGAMWSEAGLTPHQVNSHCEPMEMNHVRETVLESFPPEAGLRKPGFDFEQKKLSLAFNFPAIAVATYGKQIEWLRTVTAWTVTVSEEPHEGSLRAALVALLPTTIQLVKFRATKNQATAEVFGDAALNEIEKVFALQTGIPLSFVVVAEHDETT